MHGFHKGQRYPEEDSRLTKTPRLKFQRQTYALIWKSYIQRQRKWRILIVETLWALCLCLIAVVIAKPVLMTPLQDEPEPPLSSNDILMSLNQATVVGFAPDNDPYISIMDRAAEILQIQMLAATTLEDLNILLYNRSRNTAVNNDVLWIIWEPQENSVWKFAIRSTEAARYANMDPSLPDLYHNVHLRSGFLAVQQATSQALLEYISPSFPQYELSLVSMPVSPLMQEERVRKVISMILMCFTLALLPPVLETEALVVTETLSRFKRALRVRDVSYSSMYIAWMVYTFLTCIPICLIGSITLILIFRWIHLMYAMLLMLSYVCVMMMLAFIMAMFHNKAAIACVWTTLFTLMQTFLAELMVHHKYDSRHSVISFFLHMIVPPLGLVHGFNQFALLQTGLRGRESGAESIAYTVASWFIVIIFHFVGLMLLQRTIGQDRAIGGQRSWKAIVFKKTEDVHALHPIETLTGKERDNLEKVSEYLAKAISFYNVSKSIMGQQVLANLTFDIYRCEYTNLYSDRLQEKMMNTIEDLLLGLTRPDTGTINVLGSDMASSSNFINEPLMMGYCHRATCLIDRMTVDEHFALFAQLSLWSESNQYVAEYIQVRMKRLLKECELTDLLDEHVVNLSPYYRAQLTWAIAMLLEPRVLIVPTFIDDTVSMSVIQDKIVQYKGYITVVKLCSTSLHLECSDRIFLFDQKILAFGGTPAYLFYVYGREYRFRMTFKSGCIVEDSEIEEILEQAEELGATVRAYLGSLLILRIPTKPTHKVANFVKYLKDNSERYGVTSMHIGLPDCDEVCKRAMDQMRNSSKSEMSEKAKEALQRIASKLLHGSKNVETGREKKPRYKRKSGTFQERFTQLSYFAWKFWTFYIQNKLLLAVTILSTMVAGVLISLSFASLLLMDDRHQDAMKVMHGDMLTVESLDQPTILVVGLDESKAAKSIANAYVLSHTGAKQEDVDYMAYTSLKSHTLTEYLATRAIDSPQKYVYLYAYGLDVQTNERQIITVQALYSPLHQDHGAAARSLARVYMALLRYFTGVSDASIEITDNPLVLDQTTWMKYATSPPLLVQFLLVLSIAHITILPSREYGLTRHTQIHAYNFSPARYWFYLFLCDLIMYWLLISFMTVVMAGILMIMVPRTYYNFKDLIVLPFLLFIYGLGCIPQAYLFSLGRRSALNCMLFIIFNIVFGETTIITKLFYGNINSYASNFLLLSPQFNMAHALVKIKRTFIYNSECIIFEIKNLCSAKMLHKCCEKCGVLQNCFSKRSYLNFNNNGILVEVLATILTGAVFTCFLIAWEYRVFHTLKNNMMLKLRRPKPRQEQEMVGAIRERKDVMDKVRQLDRKHVHRVDTFGEFLLAENVSKRKSEHYVVRNVYLGLSKGEALGLCGLTRHGRLELCKLLAGYTLPNEGQIWSMSKRKIGVCPHLYARNMSFCSEEASLPTWMTVHDALELIAVLRGLRRKDLESSIRDYLDALDLVDVANTPIGYLSPYEKKRVNFISAILGAPPVVILDEYTSYQRHAIRRAMYHILYHLRKRGHAILASSSCIETHMPVTNRIAVMLDGRIYDIDHVDALLRRYGDTGYTVVVHLTEDFDCYDLFPEFFDKFIVNDTAEKLINVQVLDETLDWVEVFKRMEGMKARFSVVQSYIVIAETMDRVYNLMLSREVGLMDTGQSLLPKQLQRLAIHHKSRRSAISRTPGLREMREFQTRYDITSLRDLPWSVIFQR